MLMEADAPAKQIELVPGAVDDATAFLKHDTETQARSIGWPTSSPVLRRRSAWSYWPRSIGLGA